MEEPTNNAAAPAQPELVRLVTNALEARNFKPKCSGVFVNRLGHNLRASGSDDQSVNYRRSNRFSLTCLW